LVSPEQQEISNLALRSVELLRAPKNELGHHWNREEFLDVAFGPGRATQDRFLRIHFGCACHLGAAIGKSMF
jgi:hypothetical protein